MISSLGRHTTSLITARDHGAVTAQVPTDEKLPCAFAWMLNVKPKRLAVPDAFEIGLAISWLVPTLVL
jgi:hypothetical protein